MEEKDLMDLLYLSRRAHIVTDGDSMKTVVECVLSSFPSATIWYTGFSDPFTAYFTCGGIRVGRMTCPVGPHEHRITECGPQKDDYISVMFAHNIACSSPIIPWQQGMVIAHASTPWRTPVITNMVVQEPAVDPYLRLSYSKVPTKDFSAMPCDKQYKYDNMIVLVDRNKATIVKSLVATVIGKEFDLLGISALARWRRYNSKMDPKEELAAVTEKLYDVRHKKAQHDAKALLKRFKELTGKDQPGFFG